MPDAIAEHRHKLLDGRRLASAMKTEIAAAARRLEHFPTKWIPVGRKKVLKTNDLERRSDSIRSNSALAEEG